MSISNLIQLERDVLQAMQDRDTSRLAELMDPDGIGVDGPHGYMSNQALIDAIQNLEIQSWKMSEDRVLPVGGEGAVVSYRFEQKARFGDHSLPEKTYATSVWAKKPEGWRIVFHQETLIPV